MKTDRDMLENKNCFSCLYEPVWHQQGTEFSGCCKSPGKEDITVLAVGVRLCRQGPDGRIPFDSCPRWTSVLSSRSRPPQRLSDSHAQGQRARV